MGLTTVLLSLVYPVLFGTMKAITRADADVQSQQKAVLLVEKFFADFASTNRASLTVVESLPAASFLSQREMTVPSLPDLRIDQDYYPSNADTFPVVWRKFIALTFDAPNHQLLRLEFPYPRGTLLACMTPTQLTQNLAAPQYQTSRRKVVDNIERLRLKATGDSSLNIELTSKVTAGTEKTTRLQVTLTMRN